jgi:hypothetical protein
VEDRRYSFTTDGLERIKLAGLTADEVWTALGQPRRVLWPFSEGQAALYAMTVDGRYIVVALEEAGDEDWDITGARHMDTDEVARFRDLMRRSGGED